MNRSCLKEGFLHEGGDFTHPHDVEPPHVATFYSAIRRIAARLRSAFRFQIPTGYQDETGFHFGVKPPEKNVKWPPFW